MDMRSYDMDAAKKNKPRPVELRCEAQSVVTWTHRSCNLQPANTRRALGHLTHPQ